jgi:ribosomal protein S6
MSLLRKYEIMLLLTEEFNDSELKSWVFNYAKSLRKFSVCDISVISRGKHNLAYPISNRQQGNYIQLNFSSMPKYISNFSKILKMDSNVLRFLVFNKSNSK